MHQFTWILLALVLPLAPHAPAPARVICAVTYLQLMRPNIVTCVRSIRFKGSSYKPLKKGIYIDHALVYVDEYMCEVTARYDRDMLRRDKELSGRLDMPLTRQVWIGTDRVNDDGVVRNVVETRGDTTFCSTRHGLLIYTSR